MSRLAAQLQAHNAEPSAPVVMPQLSPSDLADLLGAFNDASRKLQESHEALRSEVSRLKSELRDANEQLERSRRLAALGEMAAGISHEVRNPLGSIRLYAKMLVDDLADRPIERAVAEKIGLAVRGLDAVVGDVLAFAREMTLRPARHDARELLERALEEVLAGVRADASGGEQHQPARATKGVVDVQWTDAVSGSEETSARKSGRSSRRSVPHHEAPEVWCDGAMVHRALVNVLRNAIEAVREHAAQNTRPGTIVLCAGERVQVDPDGSRKRWCVLSVRDTGGGIPAEAMNRIFNPFFTTRATGTGLGLAIVHRIMDAHAGRVSVRNVPADSCGLGAGALVELQFPLATHACSEHVESDADGRRAQPVASWTDSTSSTSFQDSVDTRCSATRRTESASLSGVGASPAARASSVCMEAS